MIHPLSEVHNKNIPESTNIWQFCVILEGCKIGNNCNINMNVFIENNVTIGNNVTIKSGVQIWDDIHIEDDVFIGPNVTFINDRFPKSKVPRKNSKTTIIKKGSSIGANSTIMCGVVIGTNSLVGAASFVNKNVGDNELWYGNPATLRKKI